jgi:hypothetical protein
MKSATQPTEIDPRFTCFECAGTGLVCESGDQAEICKGAHEGGCIDGRIGCITPFCGRVAQVITEEDEYLCGACYEATGGARSQHTAA